MFCIGFLILYSSNMYGDEIYLCNKAIFKEVICPSTEGLLKNNPEAAKVFAYHIFGLALSQLAEFHSTKSLDKSVTVTLHNLLRQLKKERNELRN
ncbi:hypothetical protein K5D49_16675 [Acinetobacter baumannii]|nr:hypothetical protein [Acinetobacter baumannii]